ncbi:MAG: electron transfer flavoprotein subunit beta/FixA family protein [Leptospiraceae bacterium]|nr:electron transfer flavoprotein subunit beta/FixA family protein [Leptospiraceae bacterium]MDW7977070.1 electron transfer flavoprotein subunit beta/FixA family protein [Leptospiraceae bacterium]
MKIAVLIKQVPDTETQISAKISGNKINESGIKWIVSPFDEHALEEALRIREKHKAEVVAISLGPDRVQEAIRTAYAFGVDKGLHIRDTSYNTLDIFYTANVLAAVLKKENPDVILTGHIAIDSQSSMVPAMIAQILGIPNINNAIKVEIQNSKVKVTREIEGGIADVETELPVVITATKKLNEPKYPTLKGILAAKKKNIEVIEVDTLGLNIPRIQIISIEPPPPRPPGRIIDGETPEAKAKELVRLLREEAKVI